MKDFFSQESLSAFIKRTTDILLVMNPRGTSMGAVLGIVLYGLVELFKPSLSKLQAVDFGGINIIFFVSLGIFIFNLPTVLRHFGLDPQIESALHAITKAKRDGQITHAQARLMYLNLYEKVLAQVVLKKETQEKINHIEQIVNGTDTLKKP